MAFTIVPNLVSSKPTATVIQDMMYQIIVAATTAWGPTAIRSSGDGLLLYDATGNVFTQGLSVSAAASIGNPSAWFVLAPPDGSYYLCYQRAAGFGLQFGCWFSLDPFTGGAPSPTVRPTSATEQTIRTTASGDSLVLGSTSPSYIGGVTHGIFGDADEEYAFIILNYSSGLALGGGAFGDPTMGAFFVDVCEPSFVNVDQPSRHIVCPFSMPATGFAYLSTMFEGRNNTRTPSTAPSRPFCWFRDTSSSLTVCGLATGGGSNNSTTNYRFGWEGTRTVDLMKPVWLANNREFSDAIIKGASRLFRRTSTPNALSQVATEGRSGPLCFSSDLQWWFLGKDGTVAVPWDGITDMVIDG